VESDRPTSLYPQEQAKYFSVPGAELYTVLHQAPDPIARVLLVGPFASERHFSYHPWVRWARYLAARRIEVLRYDYRGIGESTGDFENISFGEWLEDMELLAKSFAESSPRLPFVLHGLELGAILAARGFDQGLGDGLLLWSPPKTANQALRSSLLRWAGLEQLFESAQNRKPASEYIRELESGRSIEVQGYTWSSNLWHSSNDFLMPDAIQDTETAGGSYNRPIKIVVLDKAAAPLVKPYVGYDEIRDLSWLYAINFEWILENAVAPHNGTKK
jgi:alpha-beta hydrolase superfamily lysophospholipase